MRSLQTRQAAEANGSPRIKWVDEYAPVWSVKPFTGFAVLFWFTKGLSSVALLPSLAQISRYFPI